MSTLEPDCSRTHHAQDFIRSMLADPQRLPREADTVVLWVFRDHEGRWCARMEGEEVEHAFASREAAVAAARATGRAWGSYRLFLALKDGRMMQEALNLGLRGGARPR